MTEFNATRARRTRAAVYLVYRYDKIAFRRGNKNKSRTSAAGVSVRHRLVPFGSFARSNRALIGNESRERGVVS